MELKKTFQQYINRAKGTLVEVGMGRYMEEVLREGSLPSKRQTQLCQEEGVQGASEGKPGDRNIQASRIS